MNNKGISPLIATVLLLAFAVALGTMLVSYVLEATHVDPCSDVKVSFEGPACFTEQATSLVISNKGNAAVSSLQVLFISPNKDPETYPVANSLKPGDASKLDLPFHSLAPTDVTVTVTPKVMKNGNEQFCADQEIKAKLELCG